MNPERGTLLRATQIGERPVTSVRPKPGEKLAPGSPGSPEPKKPTESPEKPKKEKTPSGKKARMALAGLAILGTVETTGAVVQEQINEQPISAQSVVQDLIWPWNLGKSAIEDIRAIFNKEAKVPSTFDNAKDSGTMGSNNIVNIDETTLANIDTIPEVPTPKHDINILTPFQGIQSNINIDYGKDFRGQNQPLYGLDETKYAKEQNIKDNIIFKSIPKDTIILAPVDGLLEFYARPEKAPAGTIEAVNFFYKSPEGTLYQIGMGGSPGDFFKPLVDAKPYMFERNVDESVLRVEIKRGQPIALTLQSTDLGLTTVGWPSGEIGVGSSKTYPANINLITLPDNLGQSKVAILEK